MIRFKLSPEDRERLGAPEVIAFDETRLMLSEARAVQKASGYHPDDWFDGLKKGAPDAVAAVVWLALRRAGVEITYDDVDFDLGALVYEEPEPEGKDQG